MSPRSPLRKFVWLQVICKGVDKESLDARCVWFEEVSDWLGKLVDRVFVEVNLVVIDVAWF